MNNKRNLLITYLTLLIIIFLLLSVVDAKAQNVTPSYEDYAFILKTYVNDEGMVNYEGLKANRKRLDSFTQSFAGIAPNEYEQWTKEGKIAFWINAYNSLTLKTIIDNYPIKSSFVTSLIYPKNSIRQISGVWTELTFSVMGKHITLDEIEHERLRKDFNEPRIHMALVCAAMSCPELRNEPYRGSRLDSQLREQVNEFLNNPHNFKYDSQSGKVYLSSIFKWFGEDFVKTYGGKKEFGSYGKKEGAVLNFISLFLDEKDSTALKSQSYSIIYRDYDWSLNEQKK